MCSAGRSENGTRLQSCLKTGRSLLLQPLPRPPRMPRMTSLPATFWPLCRRDSPSCMPTKYALQVRCDGVQHTFVCHSST